MNCLSKGWRQAGSTPSFLDVVAGVVVTGLFWLPPAVAAEGAGPRTAGCGLAAVAGTSMLVRKSHPRAATGATGLSTLVGSAMGVCQDPMLATAWCLYYLALRKPPQSRQVIALLIAAIAAVIAVTGVPPGAGTDLMQRLVLAASALSVAWMLGTAVGRQIVGAREAERARVQLDVARDVHDVVGHALGVISAEAGVMRGLPDAGAQELRDSLAMIEAHSRQTLEEVQSLVRELRLQPEQAAHAGSPTERVRALVERTRAGGIGVDARIDVATPLPDPVGTVVVRVVQESLANVLRHADGAPCSVDVHESNDAVVVRVRDHGPGAAGSTRSNGPPLGGGLGLPGILDRAGSVGGTATWGDHPEGGFEVDVRLPLSRGRDERLH